MGFAKPGFAFQQHVAAGDEGNQNLIHHVRLSEDHGAHSGADAVQQRGGLLIGSFGFGWWRQHRKGGGRRREIVHDE